LSVKITTAELLVPGYDEDAVRYPTAIVADILVDKYSKKGKCGQCVADTICNLPSKMLSVTSDAGNLSCRFRRCMVFRFRVKGGNWIWQMDADGRTDGRTDG